MSQTEYDFTKVKPIEFDKIEEGMLIMHRDKNGFYIGVADDKGDSLWMDDNGEYVADKDFQNYRIPEKPKPLPTTHGARIRTTSEFNGGVVAKGAELTYNAYALTWFLDGYANQFKADSLEGVGYESVKTVSADA